MASAPFRNGESAYYMNLNRNKKGVIRFPHRGFVLIDSLKSG